MSKNDVEEFLREKLLTTPPAESVINEQELVSEIFAKFEEEKIEERSEAQQIQEQNLPDEMISEVFSKIAEVVKSTATLPQEDTPPLEIIFEKILGTEKAEEAKVEPPSFISTETTNEEVKEPVAVTPQPIKEEKQQIVVHQGDKGDKGEKGDKGDRGDPGKTILLRKTDSSIEWKYSDEKEWRELVALDELRPKTPVVPPANNKLAVVGGGGGGHKGDPGDQVELRTTNAGVLQWKYLSSTTWVDLYTLPTSRDSGGGSTAPDESLLSKRIDMHEDFIYKGEGYPGALDNTTNWRISRTYINPDDGDIIVTWAGGNASFRYKWTDHLTLDYS